MAKPIVVIVGRPNVGKSTLFNRITESQSAITENIPGVTRDRNYLDAEWDGKQFVVVDTGGFYPKPPDNIFLQMKEQALFAIGEADVIIHMLDGKDGLVPPDMEIGRLLRASGKKVLWAVNKIDGPTRNERLYDFYPLGTEELWPLSAATGHGYDDLMERLSSFLPAHAWEKIDYPQIAVVGRPNVGKSTLVNTLLGKKRMIVSPVPGTTRDSIDSVCTYHGVKYLLIDTAGIKRKDMSGYSLERFAAVRAVKSIMRCDVALIVLDAGDGITDQDQKIAGIVDEYGKGAVFLLNKWDLLEKSETTYKALLGEVGRKMWFMRYAPVLTVSALERKRVTKVFPLINEIAGERKKRIPTAELNRTLNEIQSAITLPSYRGRPVRLNYITQVRTEPPAFTVFVNYPAALKGAHIRHIENVLRNNFSFRGTPIRIYIKEKARRSN